MTISPADSMAQALRDVSALLNAEPLAEHATSAEGLVSMLLLPELKDRLLAARRAFEEQLPFDEQDLWWVRAALELRVALEQLAGAFLRPTLFHKLDQVDTHLRDTGPALALLPDDDYRAAWCGAPPIAAETWWGWRETQQRKLPDTEVERRLTDAARLRREGRLPPLRVVSQPKDTPIRTIVRDILDQVDRWLGAAWSPAPPDPTAAGVAAFAADVPAALGAVPVVIALSPEAAIVLGLRVAVKEQSSDPFAGCPLLGTDARAAVLSAFRAASSVAPAGLPPVPFERHQFSLVGETADLRVIEGNSLAAPVALALASAWTGRPCAPGAASASLALRPDGWQLGRVDYLEAKAKAVAAAGAPCLWIAPGQQVQPGEFELRIATPGSLVDLLRSAALLREGERSLPMALSRPAWSQTEIQKALEDACERVRFQRFGPGESWDALGDRILMLVDALLAQHAGWALTPKLVTQGRTSAALAYTHAGDAPAAVRIADLVPAEARAKYPELRDYWVVVKAGAALDTRTALDDEMLAHLQALEAVAGATPAGSSPGQPAARVRAMAKGTHGRILLHLGGPDRLAEAMRWTRDAIGDFEASGFPEEVGRSRVTLAMCVRRGGDGEQAVRILGQAISDIDAHMRRFDVPYSQQTAVFALYELSRALLDAGQYEDALHVGTRVAATARQRGQLRVWPLLGILRTLSWCLDRRGGPGDDAARQQILAEIDALGVRDGVLERIAAEAHGPYRRDGEVY